MHQVSSMFDLKSALNNCICLKKKRNM